MGISVIIPSKNASNFLVCAEAVRRNEPEAKIVLIDDGMDLSWLPRPDLMPCYGIKGEPKFIFSRNVNKGLTSEFAQDGDCVILNDDALLQTPGGLSLLQQAADENPEYGIIAATTNNVGNKNQFPKGIGLREDPRMVCFVCVLIPRRTIEAVGLLDEEFTGYGYEDDSYCLRVRRAGLKIGIHDGVFVDHKSLPSTFRSGTYPSEMFRRNEQIFFQKYGASNHEL